jgi:hypothetical protein
VFHFGELSSGYPTQSFYHPIGNVLTANVAVKVDEQFEQVPSFLSHFVEHSENQLFVVERTVATLQKLQKNPIDKHEGFLLQMNTEVLVQIPEYRHYKGEY